MVMKRADRRDTNYDNAIQHPRGRQKEPMSRKELEQCLLTARSQRDEYRQKAKENEEAVIKLVYFEEKIVSFQVEIKDWQTRADKNYQLYSDTQKQYQDTLTLYDQEKAKTTELLAKYEKANTQKETYLTLYNETKEQLKYERKSKAGIKGWSTRRKKENERLKQEIGQMTRLLKDSLERKEDAINNLYIMAERMERIQDLVDSVEGDSSNTPVALLDKLKRIWMTIKDILAE